MLNEKQILRQNPSYKSDVEYTIKTCRIFSQMLGLWPTNIDDANFQRILKIFLHFVYYFITLFTYASSVLHGIFVLHDLHPRLLISGPLIFWTMLLVKYTLFWMRSDDIKRCIKYIEEDWQQVETSKHREVMIKSAKFGSSITIICALFMYAGGIFYHVIAPLTAEPIITAMNISVQPFPTPAYGTFFTKGLSPVYEVVFAILAFSGLINDTMNVMTFSLAAVLILHAAGQFDVVILDLSNLVKESKDSQDAINDRLVNIVRRHLRVLRFISHLEDLLTEVCLIEVLGSMLIICLLGYYLIAACKEAEVSEILAYSFLIASFIFNIFIYCYIGDLLTRQAIKVGESIYVIEWYNLPKHTILDLVYLIRISQYPKRLTAGKFTTLSLISFSSIMKTSAAYFNFVWRMTQ